MTKNKKPSKSELLLSVSTDIVGSGIVGTVLGVSLDKIFDTKPILLIICLIFSLIAGMKLIYENVK